MGAEQDSGKFRSFAIAFLKEAKEDLDTAEDLLEFKRYSRIVFFCQQAAEKAVKSLLEMEKIFIAEHEISNFFVKFIYNNENYKDFKKEIEEILENLHYFEGRASETRYPKEKGGKVITPIEIYKNEDAQISIEKAKEVYSLIKKILIKKFKFEEEKRKLDYKKAEEAKGKVENKPQLHNSNKT